MKALLINPRWAFVVGDYAGSGIPYWPISLNILGTLLQESGHHVDYLDLPALGISKKKKSGQLILQGAELIDFQDSLQPDVDFIVVYAMNYAGLTETLATVRLLHDLTSLPIYLLQNSQAVTSYEFSERVKLDFKKAGVYEFLEGGPIAAAQILQGNVPDEYVTGKKAKFKTKWTRLQIDAYNQLAYSHGPKSAKYVPILTSLGCPFGCDFCVIPTLTNRKWNYKSSHEVVEEMMYYSENYGINHFQIEDLNPTINWPRWFELSNALLNHQFTYALVSGTKSESIPLGSAQLLFDSGARYISISPESGSKRLMQEIGKHFDHTHALELVREFRSSRIRTQACFLLAHPKEKFWDKIQTLMYMAKLTVAGVDEMALFTVAPHPGSALVRQGLLSQENSEVVTFSGVGRDLKLRTTIYRQFIIVYYLFLKFLRPISFFKAILRTLQMKPETKTENILSRMMHIQKMD